MTCTKAPKIQAIFRIFSPISGIFRGYCKTLSTKTRIVTFLALVCAVEIIYCKTLSTKTRIVTPLMLSILYIALYCKTLSTKTRIVTVFTV